MIWQKFHDLNTRNGRMQLVKFFGSERLIAADNTQQSGSYMNGVWKTAFKALSTKYHPKSIIFLGVGTGGALRIAAQKFPHAHVTGIEWDETLSNLAKERLKKEKNITIIQTEAEAWSKTMSTADLTCIDLFTGADVAPCVRDITFITSIITKSIVTFINVYTHTEILTKVDNAVAPLPCKRLQYYASTIGMYGSPHVRK